MKLSISRDTLFAALQLVGRAVSSRSTLPSLSGVKLTAGPGELVLAATDTEIGLTMKLADVSVETEGTLLLPGRLLGDVVRNLPSGVVWCGVAGRGSARRS
jgi:DNA polymerase-3 subunit beta